MRHDEKNTIFTSKFDVNIVQQFFKRNEGVSPLAFRKSFRKDHYLHTHHLYKNPRQEVTVNNNHSDAAPSRRFPSLKDYCDNDSYSLLRNSVGDIPVSRRK